MILPKLLRFGVGTHPGHCEAEAAPRKCSVGVYHWPSHTGWSISPEPALSEELWGLGHNPKQREPPMFQPLKGKSFAERVQLYKGLLLAHVSDKGQKLLCWHKSFSLMEHRKEKDSTLTDDVGSAGGLKTASPLQIAVYSHVKRLDRSISHLKLVTDAMHQLTGGFLEGML